MDQEQVQGGSAPTVVDSLTVADPPRPKKPISSYDTPTPEKQAFGERLREARELAGMSQVEAAEKMGYSQGVQLSNMEAGNRMPPLAVLMKAATLYGVTMDYLVGFAADPDPDPVAAAHRHVAMRVSAEIRSMVEYLTHSHAKHLRAMRFDAAAVATATRLTLEARKALVSVRERNAEFDDLLGTAPLVFKLESAAEASVLLAARAEAWTRVPFVASKAPEDAALQCIPWAQLLEAFQPLPSSMLESEPDEQQA